jgi:O-antigen/teichoic acid export membrane protein
MESKVEISKKLLLVNTASSLFTKLLNILVLLWLYQHLLEKLTTEEYSLLPVIGALMAFVPMVIMLLSSAQGRYIVEAYAKGDEDRITQIVSTMFPILALFGVLLLGGGFIAALYIDHLLHIPTGRLTEARIMLGLLTISFAIRTPLTIFTIGFRTKQRFVALNLIETGTHLARITLLFVLLFGFSTKVLWVVVAQVVSNLGGMVVTVIQSRRLLPCLTVRLKCYSWQIARELISFGGWSFTMALGETLRTELNPILLNRYGTALDVATFHIGSMGTKYIDNIVNTVSTPLQSVIIAMHATNDKVKLGNVYIRGGRIGLWSVLFLALPMVIFSKEIIRLYAGEEYLSAATVMFLLMIQLPFFYSSLMMIRVVNATGQMHRWAWKSLIRIVHKISHATFAMGFSGIAT